MQDPLHTSNTGPLDPQFEEVLRLLGVAERLDHKPAAAYGHRIVNMRDGQIIS